MFDDKSVVGERSHGVRTKERFFFFLKRFDGRRNVEGRGSLRETGRMVVNDG